MKRMHLKYGVLTILVLALVALAAAPAASAKAEILTATATETYVTFGEPEIVATGGVLHVTVENVLYEDSSSPLTTGLNSTHLVAVVDPETMAGYCHGTWLLVTDDGHGTWEGTFAGSISLATGVFDIRVSGKGVSGDVTGMNFIARDVCTVPYTFVGYATGTIVAPRGF